VELIAHHGMYPRVHPTAFVAPGAAVIGEVALGPESSVWFNAVLRGDINGIEVGDRSNIQDGVVLHVTRQLPVVVGREVTVGHLAMIHGCTILDRVLIGMHAVILDGATVGPDAIVGAGSVVRERSRVPEGVLAAGVPARVIRALTPEERTFLRQSAAHYVEYARSYTAGS
jgi:carbonic anhydrase/acetyltransferase-like protein (isoleucine patch superfamily)